MGFSIKRLWTDSSPGRRVLLASGALTLVAGVVLLGVGLASLGGSSEEPAEGPTVIDITPSPTPGTPTPVPTDTPPPAPPLGDQPYRIVIAKLGVDAPVATYGLDANAIPEVPTGADAPTVVAWYNFSAQPGVGSNAVYAGHVTWNGPAVFYRLTSMAAGDEVRLIGSQDGKELVYRVTEVFSVDPNDPESLSVMHATPQDVITIITCDGAFVDTNDPVFGGDYSARLVVRAQRV